ncbi:MAG TPA: pimeloyl-ACP methyl ester esterase BioH [Methylophilaceae bacterium]|nr:pimeloyl-ACP methyl ester esterase BioH [Methylophilaceae bacterium]
MHLHTDTYGSGPNLVLIHGWGMHGGVWQPLVKKLSAYFCLHVIDLPGMGYSKPLEPGHLHAVAEKVAEMLPADADICGWSLGGLVAMRLAMTHPDLVRRLVLVGVTPCFTNRAASSQQLGWSDGMDANVFQQFAKQVGQDYQATLIKFLTLQCMGADNARATIKQLREQFASRPVPTMESLQKALRILLDNDLRDEIENLRKPVLLLHGDRDNLAPVQAAQWLAQHLPFGRLRVIAGAAHAPFLSHPEQFTEALVQFLEPKP